MYINARNSDSIINRAKYIIFYEYSKYLKQTDKYFNLYEKNKVLINDNLKLHERILNTEISSKIIKKKKNNYLNIKKAKVLNNSVNYNHNYIVINKGRKNNLRSGMGVISNDGLVGKITSVFTDFAIVSTILNIDMFSSAKIKELNALGSIKWPGVYSNKVNLLYIPKHLVPQIGQEVITSGCSSHHVDNIPIGKIINITIDEKSDAFYDIEVELSTNFSNLSHVYVLFDNNADYKLKIASELEKLYNEK